MAEFALRADSALRAEAALRGSSSKKSTKPWGGSASPFRCWAVVASALATSGARSERLPRIPTATIAITHSAIATIPIVMIQ